MSQKTRISSAKVVQFIRERRGIITSLAILNADGYWSGAFPGLIAPAGTHMHCTVCGGFDVNPTVQMMFEESDCAVELLYAPHPVNEIEFPVVRCARNHDARQSLEVANCSVSSKVSRLCCNPFQLPDIRRLPCTDEGEFVDMRGKHDFTVELLGHVLGLLDGHLQGGVQ